MMSLLLNFTLIIFFIFFFVFTGRPRAWLGHYCDESRWHTLGGWQLHNLLQWGPLGSGYAGWGGDPRAHLQGAGREVPRGRGWGQAWWAEL